MAKLSDVQLSALLSIRLPFEKYSIAEQPVFLTQLKLSTRRSPQNGQIPKRQINPIFLEGS